MANKLPEILIGLWLVLLPITTCAQSNSPELLFKSFGVNPDLREMFPGESVKPPYRIELWVASNHGLPAEGTKDLIEDFLKEDLHGLGDVEVVHFLTNDESKSSLRLRVWYSKLEKPDAYDCFDISLAVVVGKTARENSLAEIVIDAYALAGVSSRDLDAMCQEIATRLDVNVLAKLRRIRASGKAE